ncbi:MAG: hypothetical protein WC898_02675 [Candidatus Paceibacterota bacterium]|jgi:predicted RecB family endonuclease
MDTELQNLINEYVKQIENKEEDLVNLKQNIEDIISFEKEELEQTITELDKCFDKNEINEEEYLTKLRAEKENIINKTKEKLKTFLAQCEKKYSA